MKSKTDGIICAVGSPFIGGGAYWLYQSGRPAFALIWGVVALIWIALSIVNFRMARGQSNQVQR